MCVKNIKKTNGPYYYYIYKGVELNEPFIRLCFYAWPPVYQGRGNILHKKIMALIIIYIKG